MDGLRELGVLVRRYRSATGMSGAELARRASVPQPSVSRVEAGHRLADLAVVERLVSSLGLDGETAGPLLEMARREYAVPVRVRSDAGVSMLAGQFVRHVRAARLVRSFSAATIPVLLRTADYAAAAAGGRGGASDWDALAGLLEDAGRSFSFVVTEGALRTWPGSVPMDDQLAQVQAASERPNVRLGVVPWQVPVPRLPLLDFTVFDTAVAWAETFAAELTVTRAAEVAACVAGFAALEQVAVYGDAARTVIGRVAADFARIAR